MDNGKSKKARRGAGRFPRTWTGGIALALFLALAGCTTGSTAPGAREDRPGQWSAMDLNQRKRHMEQVILPLAAAVFQSWRPERYAVIDCTLCHGQGFQAGDFRMPTSHLPRLSGEVLLGTEFRTQPETTRLKLDRLVPEMAAALGKKSSSA